MTKSDLQLKQDVEGELDWDPKINAAQLGVSVDKGVVSLLGRVGTYAEKLAAEQAVKRVSGVRAVSQNLTVHLAKHHERSDADIAAAVENALTWNVLVPEGVTATVEFGCIDLAGEVVWNHQRNAAEQAVRNLVGVVNVNSSISIMPETLPEQVKQKVQAALQRQATADVRSIHIVVSGGQVTLTGYAASWQAIEDAANAAWAVPGVTEVSDRVKVSIKSPTSL
jgi:osmotically-inducible protein OsmY